MKKIISLIIVCMIIISGMFIYGKSDKKDLLEDNNLPIIAAVINGKASTTFPTTNKYTATVECTKNGIKQDVGAKATWNGTKWVVSFNDISAGNVRCNAIFKTPNFAETILANNEVKTPITTPGAAISTADEALLASAEDDYGTSYYFRGAVENNYVEFANKCWRIVRIVGDGSVKLILHNDNTTGAANPCDSANNSASAAFARYSGTTYNSAFNENTGDNGHVGFMYGDFISSCNNHPEIISEQDCYSAGYTWGTSSYIEAHANINKSTILVNLETWYTNNLASYADKLADTIWCNDKSTVSAKPGYGTYSTVYAAYNRVYSTGQPTLICPIDNSGGKLSKFTVDDTINGNGNLTYKVGLITADELAYAGYAKRLKNTTTYLQENATSDYWWSLSPSNFSGHGALVWYGGSNNHLLTSESVGDSFGVRPSISLKPSTNVTGDGTSEKPYVVN